MAEANADFDAGRWQAADRNYREVLDNPYATAAMRERATAQRQRIEAQRKLDDAAQPGVITITDVSQGTGTPAPAMTTVAAAPPEPTAEPRRLTPVDELRMRDELLWQRAVAQAQELSAQARDAMAANDYELARRLVDDALQRIEAHRTYAEPVSKYVAARDGIEQLRSEINTAQELWQQEQAQRERDEIAVRVERRAELIEQARREKVESLFVTASQLRKQGRFEEAAEVLRQILYIDPANAKARDQLEMAEDYASLTAQAEWQRDLYSQTRSAVLTAQEALIPWDYEVLYPRNWLELSAKRDQARGIGGPPEDTELNRKLDQILPQFEFEEAPLGTIIDHLHESQELNIAIDWDDLSNVGIEADRPISLALRNLPLRVVLKEILAQAGGQVPLTFAVSDGLLRIATRDKLDCDKFIRVYDVRDLLMSAARFTNAARLDPTVVPDRGGDGRRGEIFSSSSSPENQSVSDPPPLSDHDMIRQVMSVIRQTVATDSWQEMGGGDASIRELNGQLIVYQTAEAHGQVRGLLDQLRARRALQIALEARVLNVTSNFLEEFGVDLDFVFNNATAGYDQAFSGGNVVTDPGTGAPVLIPRTYSQIGSYATPPAFGTPMAQSGVSQPYGAAAFVPNQGNVGPHLSEFTPISARQNSIVVTDPNSLSTGVPGSFAGTGGLSPMMNIAGSFLDNLQVDFLIRATQANRRSAIVQAPRVVMENWSQTYIQIGRAKQYVSTINAQVAEGAALAQPVPATANSGTTLSVYGTVSSDRKYVAVRVELTQADAPTFERFQVTQPSGNSPGVFVQLLDQGFVTIATQVSVPDGGTVLLGGLKSVGEIEVEAGVPIVSKVPVLKRFFSNRTNIKDTSTLLLLLKAKIIIQSEAEEEAFPTFSAATGG